MEYDIKANKHSRFYYKKGTNLLHREDGPAVEWADGVRWWYINGKRLSIEKEAILNQWWNNKNGI